MRYIKTYEEFKYIGKDVEVLEPTKTKILTDEPIDPSLLGEEEEDKGSYVDSRGVIHIKNWKTY